LTLENTVQFVFVLFWQILRHFRNTLRLSPMLFEDFCAALNTDDTSVLLNEVSVA